MDERPADAASESIELLRALDFTVVDGQLRTCRILEADQPAVDDWIARFGITAGEAPGEGEAPVEVVTGA